MRARWLLVSLVTACAADGGDSSSHWTYGKGDGVFDLVEAGPAPIGDKVDIVLDHRVPAYRVQSYGGTKLAIDLVGHDTDAYLVVEGPLDNYGDTVAIGSGHVVAEIGGHTAHLDLSLDTAGVYRVLAGSADSLGHGQAAIGKLTLSASCSASCYRGQLDQKSFVRLIQQQGGSALSDYAKAELAKLVPDAQTASQLGDQLDAMLADPNLSGLERFPLVSMGAIATLRPALGAIPAKTPDPDKVITGELAALLGDCTPDRSLPGDVDARLPGVKYGQFPSATLSPCQFAHASKLAQVLTSLAANNGSSVTFQGQTITSPRDLFAALLASGHTIEVRNERMYANFLSMIVGDRDVIWPVWLDTTLQLSSGDSFTIPMGHSQQAWRIRGPVVDTRVTFFLGISGAGFFGQTDQRPAWSGTIASSDDTDQATVLATVDTAAAYLRRNRVERSTVAAGMPADGYGYLGVCNDSNTTVEYAVKGTISAFPLLRAAALDSQPDLGDGLDDAMRALPKDGDGLPDTHDALVRAVAMQPFPDGSPLMWDAVLGAQIATARADLGK
jgi:hypothetical protein